MNTAAPVLTPTSPALAWSLRLLVVGLLALTAVRTAANGHPNTGLVFAAAAACALVYALGPRCPAYTTHERPPHCG